MASLKIDVAALLADIKANQAKLSACSVHRFPDEIAFGDHWVCERCGGHMQVGEALSYCRGYRAAGGDPQRDVWAPWTDV
jgi:hypothetical protein